MKPFLGFLFVATLTAAHSACADLVPAGPTGTKTYAVRDFDALRISSNMTADIRLGNGFNVTATGVERDLRDLRVVVNGTTRCSDKPSGRSGLSRAA